MYSEHNDLQESMEDSPGLGLKHSRYKVSCGEGRGGQSGSGVGGGFNQGVSGWGVNQEGGVE